MLLIKRLVSKTKYGDILYLHSYRVLDNYSRNIMQLCNKTRYDHPWTRQRAGNDGTLTYEEEIRAT